jgi:DNA-directed RNA polymerase subunit RPC12/RpoP
LASPAPQRVYRAPCPGCGAPVEFRSAQSTHAVCSYCHSTVVRAGETLQRLGKMSEVFEDYSPLQLMASGRYGDTPFTLVGRLQFRGGGGSWTEWQAAFDDGRVGQLSEDNGSYVMTFPAPLGREVPPAERFRVGGTTAVAGKTFSVSANDDAALVSAQGELPKLPPLNHAFRAVELRSPEGEVIAIDYGTVPPQVSRGRGVRLDELQLVGLRAEAAKEEKGRQFACPNCGAPVQVNLAGTLSITCPSCGSIIDVSRGIGGELKHAEQDEPVRPLIPLGTRGKLQGSDWQVVGFQHRMGTPRGAGEDDDEEHFGWSEYLLYNAGRGFVFLVDSEEGWSVVKPVTGAPKLAMDGRTATHLHRKYQLKYSYDAETNYVAGEFYWPVVRGQKTFNRDFADGNLLLSMEQSPREITWSSGSAMPAAAVAAAFGMKDKASFFERGGDAGPTSGGGGASLGCGCLILILLFLVVLVMAIAATDDNDSSSGYVGGPRTSGGSWGGYSGGGGHK